MPGGKRKPAPVKLRTTYLTPKGNRGAVIVVHDGRGQATYPHDENEPAAHEAAMRQFARERYPQARTIIATRQLPKGWEWTVTG